MWSLIGVYVNDWPQDDSLCIDISCLGIGVNTYDDTYGFLDDFKYCPFCGKESEFVDNIKDSWYSNRIDKFKIVVE